ncbi:MAG TPA: S-adenosylmethionine decarboxylase [Terracidiphilus sp.]|jgi:S-adenosylmethionine decarboxylase
MNGTEWIVDAQGCGAESLRSLAVLHGLFAQIIEDLDLRTIGDTQWHQFPGSGGITGLCLLSESHLTCHTFPEFGSLCLNLFCCVPRTRWDFESKISKLFSATSVHVRVVSREYSETEVQKLIGTASEGP